MKKRSFEIPRWPSKLPAIQCTLLQEGCKSKNQCLQILIKCTFLYSKPRWTLKIRSYSMTLFLITFFRTPWGHFSKNTWKFWKLGKKNFLQVSTSEKMENIKIFKVFFAKKSYFFCLDMDYVHSQLSFEVYNLYLLKIF